MSRLFALTAILLASTAVADEPKPARAGKAEQPAIAQSATEKAGTSAAADAKLDWTDGLAAGLHAAQRDNRMLLVVAGSADCVWCEKLAAEFRKPSLVAKLKSRSLSLAHVDIEAEPTAVRSLAVGPVPALRLMSPRGAILAAHDGFLSADELLQWLDENLAHSSTEPPAILTETQPPDAKEVVALIGEFRQPDPLLREAALRRLAPYPKLAVAGVSAALEKGNLETRLTALELLDQWHAPLAGLDPWRPDSFSESRRKTLAAWIASVISAGKSPALAPPSPQEIEAAAAEIDRLADLPDADADALCERLARFHAALLPQAIAAWKAATSDRARQRLLTLRYRLVASDLVMLTWPGGLARLASGDAAVRHKATEELVERSTADDQPLLLELFKDPDPLVREISLRGLQHVSPGQTGGALAALLDDPDPNVRAAVLKQLAEDPAADLAAKVAAYAEHEKDPDLLVHALRYLKGMPRPDSLKAAIVLLKHPNWQVRAEAVDAVSRLAADEKLTTALRAEASSKISELTDDPEPFVISRVFHGLIDNGADVSADRLVKAANKHPELTADVVSLLLGRWHSTSAKDIDVLRAFVKQPDPSIRLAILSGLRGDHAAEFSTEIIESLSDKSPAVREAAARLLFKAAANALENARSNRSAIPGDKAPEASLEETKTVEEPSLLSRLFSAFGGSKAKSAKPAKPTDVANKEPTEPPDPSQEWLARFRKSKGLSGWMHDGVGPLVKMLDGGPGERIAAATALVALGEHADRALPLLKQSVRDNTASIESVAEILPWLPWHEREEWFDLLTSLDPGHDELRPIVQQMVVWPDDRAAPLIWKQLAPFNDVPPSSGKGWRPLAPPRSAADSQIDAIYSALRSLAPQQGPTLADDPFTDGAPHRGGGSKKEQIADLKRRAEHGKSLAEQVVALAILCDLGSPETAEAATAVQDDPKSPADLRLIALKAMLLGGAPADAVPAAIKGLQSPEQAVKRMSLLYLSDGPGALSDFGYGIYIYKSGQIVFSSSEEGAIPQPPKGLKADAVRPLVKDDDPDVAAGAGYLLALLGEGDGLDAVVRRWRSANADDMQWPLRVAAAISALDDPQKVPILEEIYKKLSGSRNETYTIRQFYWTIRSMHGAEVLKLRKKIRDDVGMENLR